MPLTTLAALRFTLLIAFVFVMGGCFETYEGSLSVTAQTPTVHYLLNNSDGFKNEKPIAFTIINGNDAIVENVRIAVRLVINSGNSPVRDGDIKLVSPTTQVTGTGGDYTISSIPALGSVEIQVKARLEPGTYTWSCTADPSNSLEEYDENDNAADTALTVTQPPLANINLSFDSSVDITFSSDENYLYFTVPVQVKTRLPSQMESTPGPQVPLIRITAYTNDVEITRWQYYSHVSDNSRLEFLANPPMGDTGTIRLQIDSSNIVAETDEGDNTLIINWPLIHNN